MEQKISCFEWRSRTSDYLDGAITGTPKQLADQHLDECPFCNEKQKHYRVLLSTIGGMPRYSIPSELLTEDLAQGKGKIRESLRPTILLSKWDRSPWYFKTLMEGATVICLVLLGVNVGPRLRVWYEKHGDRMSEIAMTDGDLGARTKTNSNSNPAGAPSATSPQDMGGDAASGDDDEGDSIHEEELDVEVSPVHVGKAEVWRFQIKTDNGTELREKLVSLFNRLKISDESLGTQGIEAPGGIQFDFMAPIEQITQVRTEIERLALEFKTNRAKENITWFKVKSKTPIPAGKNRVIIWISQL